MEIKTTTLIQRKHPCDGTRWVNIDDLIKYIKENNYESDERDVIQITPLVKMLKDD